MNDLKHIYSATRQAMHLQCAHGGIGKITTARAVGSGVYGRVNFIDLTRLPPGTSIGSHRHGWTDVEIYIVVTGNGEMLVDGCVANVSQGDVIVNPPGGTHGLTNTGQETMALVVVDIALE